MTFLDFIEDFLVYNEYMLFRDDYYNGKYEFCKDVVDGSYWDVCRELDILTQKIRCSNSTIYLYELDVYGRDVCISSHIKESVLNRDMNDIHNVIVRKPEFKKRLESIGLIEPSDPSYFNMYLQFVYFFYILIYFVFPDVKFMDLFLEKNWSSEHTQESDTGMELYEDFIQKNVLQNSRGTILKNRMDTYDRVWSTYQDVFFDFYSRMDGDVDSYLSYFDSKIKVPTIHYSSPYDCFIDFLMKYRSYTINTDFLNNYKELDYSCLESIYLKIQSRLKCIPSTLIPLSSVEEFVSSSSFICLCMDVNHITVTTQSKYDSYNVYEALSKVISFELYQREHYGEGFTFIEGDCISIKSIFIICMLRILLPVSFYYRSKVVDLSNRSNASKKETHSIKHSYNTMKQGELDLGNSSLRDDMFRIACRVIQSIDETGDVKDFLYFELPMNIKCVETMFMADCFPSLLQRISYYEQLNMYLGQ